MSGPPVFIKTVFCAKDLNLKADIVLPRMPTDNPDNLHPTILLKEAFLFVVPDLRYSYPFNCMYCGKPATQNYLAFVGWPNMKPKGELMNGRPSPGPGALALLHAVCSMTNRCGLQAQVDTNAMSRRVFGHSARDTSAGPPSRTQPRTGTCAQCHASHRDETLRRCGLCKTTLYCGEECQQADWRRHRQVCPWIKGVRVERTDGTQEVWKVNPEPYEMELGNLA